MQFLKGLTRWFHFGKHLAKIEHCRSCELPLDSTGMCPQCGEYPNDLEDDQPQSKLLPELSRRGFLFGLGSAAVVAALPEIPLGRVWSIPNLPVFPRNPACYDDVLRAQSTWLQIDQINRRTWASVDWGYQSTALQLERIRNELPLLYERDDMLFQIISTTEDNIERLVGAPPAMFGGKVYTQEEVSACAESHVRQAMHEFESHVDRVRRQGVTVPTPATEARKIGQLVNQFGDAVANKVDREVVKPVRDGLQEVCDLVNNA